MSNVCPKCNHVRNQHDAIEVSEGECPSCGIFYEKFLKRKALGQQKQNTRTAVDIEKRKVEKVIPSAQPASNEEKLLAHLAAAEHKTSHILHLLLSVCSIGLWVPVWLFISTRDTSQRNKIKRDQGMPTETNIPVILAGLFLALMVISVIVAK